MIDFVYNNGCSLSRNGKVFELIEQGEYKSAYDTIKNGEWGHPERRNTTAELFAKDGFPHKFINKHKTQFIGNFKTK
jgi:GH24 family phage-related lysozyme (muramidase)